MKVIEVMLTETMFYHEVHAGIGELCPRACRIQLSYYAILAMLANLVMTATCRVIHRHVVSNINIMAEDFSSL